MNLSTQYQVGFPFYGRLNTMQDRAEIISKIARPLTMQKPSGVKTPKGFLVRVARLELAASCSQMCVGTFSRHFTALFGPFLCLGSSSLKLFCPACFKTPFRLLGFVWDWILCIKRCSARFEGEMTDQSPQRSGAGIAPHKQRIQPFPPVA